MSQSYRLASGGDAVDRNKALSFTFDGKTYTGFAGDTLASALLANGVHLVGRSFKYHRPRGILSSGVDEPNALVEIDRGTGRRDANQLATTTLLFDGLVARSQNRWPNLNFDIGAINSAISRFIPAGFYYKTFLWPRAAWAKLYEPFIRKAAGLGRPPEQPDPDRYGFQYGHAEVLIAGGGRSGLQAALAASEDRNCRVVVADERHYWGGSRGPTAVVDLVAQLQARPNVSLKLRSTVFTIAGDNMVGIAERVETGIGTAGTLRARHHQIRTDQLIVATGAHQRPFVFPGNDTPGVMLAQAALEYAARYGVRVGSTAAVIINDDDGVDVAAMLSELGTKIAPIDLRDGSTIERVRGGKRVTSISVKRSNGSVDQIACDAVLMAGGFTPALHLLAHAGAKPVWHEPNGAYIGSAIPEGVSVVGRAAGRTDGRASPVPIPTDETMAFVDFQNDVTAKDLRLAVQEGFQSVEHLKRYTTTGMATDQGRTSNINAMAIAGAAMGIRTQDVGITTFRPPYTPTDFGLFAGYDRGALFDPERRTPIDGWAEAQGAVFEPVALWRRARYFPQSGEDMHTAVARECATARSSVGMFDASTLGKIEVVGPDAAEFMNRMYVNGWSKLGIGRCRYGLLLRDDGYIYDDGVVGRISADRFHVTTTTGGAPGVLAMFEDYRQTEFPDLKVWLTSTTEQWAVIALQGPKAREVIAPFITDIDLSPEAFPHMALREGHICGVPTRLFRVSFTGELGFEINVPAHAARQVWETLWPEVQRVGGCAYGTEAMHVLRAEKGFIIIGQETDGTVTPDDVGLAGMVSKIKPDFVGKRGLMRDDLVREGRKQLVGLLPDGRTPDEGAQLSVSPTPAPFTAEGHVTSAYGCGTIGKPFALAMLANGRARMGEIVYATALDGAPIACTVTAPVFVDPEGGRTNG
jgi:sarcosine oxidase, subunit alpha